ncbi:hypothetical protein TNCV_1991991 [Trichonephila clavipes]|nr:hypothetical protein TNCV_1991991 [Trichonephila clavipes]
MKVAVESRLATAHACHARHLHLIKVLIDPCCMLFHLLEPIEFDFHNAPRVCGSASSVTANASLQLHDGQIRVCGHRGERMLNSCVMPRHNGPAPDIMVWGGIGYPSRTPLLRIAVFNVVTPFSYSYHSPQGGMPHSLRNAGLDYCYRCSWVFGVWCQKLDFMPITRAMDEQLKALLEDLNALKSGQEETKERMKNMQKSQEETKERMENMQ